MSCPCQYPKTKSIFLPKKYFDFSNLRNLCCATNVLDSLGYQPLRQHKKINAKKKRRGRGENVDPETFDVITVATAVAAAQ